MGGGSSSFPSAPLVYESPIPPPPALFLHVFVLAGKVYEVMSIFHTVRRELDIYFQLILHVSFYFKAMDDERTDTPRVKSFG